MLDDIDIARNATPRPIAEIAEGLGLEPGEWRPFGNDVAKVALSALGRPRLGLLAAFLLAFLVSPRQGVLRRAVVEREERRLGKSAEGMGEA